MQKIVPSAPGFEDHLNAGIIALWRDEHERRPGSMVDDSDRTYRWYFLGGFEISRFFDAIASVDTVEVRDSSSRAHHDSSPYGVCVESAFAVNRLTSGGIAVIILS